MFYYRNINVLDCVESARFCQVWKGMICALDDSARCLLFAQAHGLPFIVFRWSWETSRVDPSVGTSCSPASTWIGQQEAAFEVRDSGRERWGYLCPWLPCHRAMGRQWLSSSRKGHSFLWDSLSWSGITILSGFQLAPPPLSPPAYELPMWCNP